MTENYWISLLFFAIILVACLISIWVGHDTRGSESFREKFAIKGKWAQKIVILKPMDKKQISIFEFLPYIVSAIHLLILLPVHIVYWLSDNDFLGMILKGNPYMVYTMAVLASMFLLIIVTRIIDLFLGHKERNKNK